MPIHPHSRTVAVVRFLRAAAPKDHRRRGGTRARQLQPDAIRLEYFNALRPHVAEQSRILGQHNVEIIRLLAEQRQEQDALKRDAEWNEEDHPRDEHGQFASVLAKDRTYQELKAKSERASERAFNAPVGSKAARNARIAWSRAAEARDFRERQLRTLHEASKTKEANPIHPAPAAPHPTLEHVSPEMSSKDVRKLNSEAQKHSGQYAHNIGEGQFPTESGAKEFAHAVSKLGHTPVLYKTENKYLPHGVGVNRNAPYRIPSELKERQEKAALEAAPRNAALNEAIQRHLASGSKEVITHAIGKKDATERGQRAKALIERAKREAADAFKPRIIGDIAEKYGKRTGQFQREQLDKVVRQQIGVPLSSVEKPIRDLIPAFTAENVSLVKTVPERYHDRLRAAVEDAFDSGEHPETLARRLVELDDIAESDARRIARDQIGKLNADFNQERQESMGVTGYIWRSANDQRTRDNHSHLDGEHCEWDDPPMGGGTDDTEPGHPGSGIQCRCYSDPDLSAIVDNL